jgi:hypothetical protein
VTYPAIRRPTQTRGRAPNRRSGWLAGCTRRGHHNKGPTIMKTITTEQLENVCGGYDAEKGLYLSGGWNGAPSKKLGAGFNPSSLDGLPPCKSIECERSLFGPTPASANVWPSSGAKNNGS